MQRGTTEMDRELPVKLTDDEIIERAQTMATKIGTVEALREKKARDAKNTQALIDAELDEIQRLARVITECEELRKQGELFVDQAQATSALAEVEKRAAALPTDPHAFAPSTNPLDCSICGSNPSDPVHAPVEAATATEAEAPADSSTLAPVPSFVCAGCVAQGQTEAEAEHRLEATTVVIDGEKLCHRCAPPAEVEAAEAADAESEAALDAEAAQLPPSNGAYAFDASEPPPAAVSTHAAIEGRDGDAPPKRKRRAEARA